MLDLVTERNLRPVFSRMAVPPYRKHTGQSSLTATS